MVDVNFYASIVNETSPPPNLHENSDADRETPSEADEYTVRQEFFQEFTRRLKIRPTHDCFACPGETLSLTYWAAKEDALMQVLGPDEIFRVNLMASLATNCRTNIKLTMLSSLCTP